MTEENKSEISTEMEVNPESTKVELSEEEMDEINGGGGVNLAMLLDVSGKGKKPRRSSRKRTDEFNAGLETWIDESFRLGRSDKDGAYYYDANKNRVDVNGKPIKKLKNEL